jgi:hypothetical protein
MFAECSVPTFIGDSFWALSYPILPLIDPSYKKHQKDGTLKDWRNVFEGSYQPKTKHWFMPEGY